MRAVEKACPLLVPLVEEGWIESPVTAEVLRIYMAELMDEAKEKAFVADTLVLGCTHYPLLRAQIEAAVPGSVRVIDSAEVTAEQVERKLDLGDEDSKAKVRFFATDSVKKFRLLGSRFLGREIEDVELVDLERQGIGNRE
jgi:glutamate racemase